MLNRTMAMPGAAPGLADSVSRRRCQATWRVGFVARDELDTAPREIALEKVALCDHKLNRRTGEVASVGGAVPSHRARSDRLVLVLGGGGTCGGPGQQYPVAAAARCVTRSVARRAPIPRP